MTVYIEDALLFIGKRFFENGWPLYVVGGYVRNALLGLPHSDIDICGDRLPEEIINYFEGSEVRVIPKAVEFGTVELHFDYRGERYQLEYTTFRSDEYGQDGAHRPEKVKFSDRIDEDAFRRDFSINAMYADLMTGEVIDPTGGMEDLNKRILCATNADPSIILRDDGLRSLRLVRFACELGFEIEKNTWNCSKEYAHLLADIPVERIWKEMQKILLSDVRYGAAQPGKEFAHYRALKMLLDLGLMKYIFPEILEGEGVLQRSDYHAFDVLNHSLHSCEASEPTLVLRLASLLHDVAKPRCVREKGSMLGHDELGATMAEEMLERLRCDKRTAQKVSALIAKHMLDLDNRAKDSTMRRRFVQMGIEMTRDFIQIREADYVGSGMQKRPIPSAERYKKLLEKMIQDGVPFSENQLAITGEDIMKELSIKPSKKVGEIKRSLWMHCANHPKDNNYSRLANLSRRFAAPEE